MRERIARALERIVSDPRREAFWLNTLSLLEFIGARKISRTVAMHHPRLEILQHWADEVRHACVFKKLACELAGGEPDESLCPEAAKTYFSELDESLTQWAAARAPLGGEALHYLLVTSAIERRAMGLYPLYRAASSNPHVREELTAVITEEQSHRKAIEELCLARLRKAGVEGLSEPMEIEQRLFHQFWSSVEKAVGLLPLSENRSLADR